MNVVNLENVHPQSINPLFLKNICKNKSITEQQEKINKMSKEHNYYVYIMSNRKHGTLYIGITNDIIRRVSEHKEKTLKGFTSKYDLNILVHYEYTNSAEDAIVREKQLKDWKRDWKIKLIEENNRDWKDLFPGLFG